MIEQAIKAINPKASFIVDGDNIDTAKIVFSDDTKEISKEDIKAKMLEIAYINKRLLEYPSIADQLDDLYHNGIDGWKTTIKAIKDKYPKG
tara:strand:+ start:31 stop:303 length:273 start_codon:yes stop_codon:yes gene_type:complete